MDKKICGMIFVIFFKDPEYHVLIDEKVMVSDINVAIGCDSAGEIDSNIYPSDTDPVI